MNRLGTCGGGGVTVKSFAYIQARVMVSIQCTLTPVSSINVSPLPDAPNGFIQYSDSLSMVMSKPPLPAYEQELYHPEPENLLLLTIAVTSPTNSTITHIWYAFESFTGNP